MIMLLGSALVAVVNFAYNVVTAHALGPVEFGHASLAVTLLMLASAITLSFQLVVAKFVAKNPSSAAKLTVFRRVKKDAWMLSSSIAVALAVFSGPITRYLQLPSQAVVMLMAAAILFYIPLGVRRGAFQGVCDFTRLAGNLVLENTIRFLAAVLLIGLLLAQGAQTAMLGAVAAITVSAVAAYCLPRLSPGLRAASREPRALAEMAAPALEGMQASVFFVGQVVINNIDIVLVKHFFPPRTAGLYAAVSLIGRVLYVASWQIVSAMFPIAAKSGHQERARNLILPPTFMIAALTGLFIVVATVFAHPIMHIVFGASFHGPEEGLLGWYALSTGFYALSVVLITYEMSRKIANTAWVQLAFAGLVIGAIYALHSSLYQVVQVQVVLKFLLLAAVAIPFLRNHRPGNLVEEAAA
jgi:O-antigen/teichoic acid export membrane protein